MTDSEALTQMPIWAKQQLQLYQLISAGYLCAAQIVHPQNQTWTGTMSSGVTHLEQASNLSKNVTKEIKNLGVWGTEMIFLEGLVALS